VPKSEGWVAKLEEWVAVQVPLVSKKTQYVQTSRFLPRNAQSCAARTRLIGSFTRITCGWGEATPPPPPATGPRQFL
jgi:hypothetical protein